MTATRTGATHTEALPEMRKHIKRLERQLKERTSKADRLAAKLGQYNARDDADRRMRFAYAAAQELELPEDGVRFLVSFARDQEADYAAVGALLRTALDIGEPYWGKTRPKVVDLIEGTYLADKRMGRGHEWATTTAENLRKDFAEAAAEAAERERDV